VLASGLDGVRHLAVGPTGDLYAAVGGGGDGKGVAAFRDRDGDGKLHKRSAVCTHMGCIVRFNTLEKTWDCPCHGSRFSTDGEPINAPAIKPLGPAT